MAGEHQNDRGAPGGAVSINNRLLTPLPEGQVPAQRRSPKTGAERPKSQQSSSSDVESIKMMREQLRQLTASDKGQGSKNNNKSPAGSASMPVMSRPATAAGLSPPQLQRLRTPEMTRPASGSPTKGLNSRTAPGFEREERIPGWRKLWDREEKAWYWIETNNHSTQWHHPHQARERKERAWDGKAKPVQVRDERMGVAMGVAGEDWFPEHAKIVVEEAETKQVVHRRAIVMMLQKWAEKWETLSRAFREMDVNHDGDLARSELATALIRFNVMHTDDLVEEAWRMLDVDGSGKVTYEEFRKFVNKYGAKQVSTEHTYFASKDQLLEAASQVLRKKHQLDTSALHRIKEQKDTNGRRIFTRKVIGMLGRLLASFEGGRGKMGKDAFVQLLLNNQLMPKNEAYVSQLFEFLDPQQRGYIHAEDLTIATLQRFAATPIAMPSAPEEKKVVWSPVDGGSTKEQMELLPPQHRKHIIHFRDLLATRCQGTKDTFRFLDHDKDGVIHRHEFVKTLQDLGFQMPAATLDYLWQILDTDQDGKIKFGEYIDLFENIRSQPRELPVAAAVRLANNPVSGLRIPTYLATKAAMSGRILNVAMMAPSVENYEKPLRVPMMARTKNLHKRQEYLGIHPHNRELREAVRIMGARTDLGAKDIFRPI